MGSFHARVLADHPRVDELVITDVDEDRAKQLAGDLGVEVVGSAAQLVERVDALVIAAASSAHAELLHLAADAGLPTFCEKPIAIDLATTNEVIEHLERAGIPLQMGFQRRFDEGYREARRLVETGKLGTIYVVRMAGHDPEPPHEAYIPASGGIFRDLHVHDFDILRWVTGQEVVEVYAEGAVLEFEVFGRYDDVDTAVAILRLSDGTLSILSGTRHDPLGYDIRMEVFGSGDSVAVGWDERTPLRSLEPAAPPRTDQAYRGFMDRFDAAYRAEMESFLALAAGGRREAAATADDARQALRISIACDLSRARRAPVRLEEVA